MRSGFATLVGRPNAGKSTLLNTILGTKVSIVSDKPQTTRTRVRGLLNRADAQVVFVDTPGIHRPRTLLGERLNETATGAVGDVDVVCLVVDATAPIGPGDRWVAAQVPRERTICVVNKTDVADREQTLRQLTAAAELDLAEYFPVSARTGDGIDKLKALVEASLPRPNVAVDALVPYERGDLVSRVHSEGSVDQLEHTAEGTRLAARVHAALAGDLAPYKLPEELRQLVLSEEKQPV